MLLDCLPVKPQVFCTVAGSTAQRQWPVPPSSTPSGVKPPLPCFAALRSQRPFFSSLRWICCTSTSIGSFSLMQKMMLSGCLLAVACAQQREGVFTSLSEPAGSAGRRHVRGRKSYCRGTSAEFWPSSCSQKQASGINDAPTGGQSSAFADNLAESL